MVKNASEYMNILFFQARALSKMKAVTELLQLMERVLFALSGVDSNNVNVKKRRIRKRITTDLFYFCGRRQHSRVTVHMKTLWRRQPGFH